MVKQRKLDLQGHPSCASVVALKRTAELVLTRCCLRTGGIPLHLCAGAGQPRSATDVWRRPLPLLQHFQGSRLCSGSPDRCTPSL